jgi:hypothetical protein
MEYFSIKGISNFYTLLLEETLVPVMVSPDATMLESDSEESK